MTVPEPEFSKKLKSIYMRDTTFYLKSIYMKGFFKNFKIYIYEGSIYMTVHHCSATFAKIVVFTLRTCNLESTKPRAVRIEKKCRMPQTCIFLRISS